MTLTRSLPRAVPLAGRVNMCASPPQRHRTKVKTAMLTLRKHRLAFILLGLIAAAGTLAPLFLIAGCRTLQQTPQEIRARETLRAMTRGGVLPAEDAVARIESDFPRTT